MQGRGDFFPEVASYETVLKLGFNYWEPSWGRTLSDGTRQTVYHSEIFPLGADEVHQVVVVQNRLGKMVNWQLGTFKTKPLQELVDDKGIEQYWDVVDGSLKPIQPQDIEQALLDYYEEVKRSLFG